MKKGRDIPPKGGNVGALPPDTVWKMVPTMLQFLQLFREWDGYIQANLLGI